MVSADPERKLISEEIPIVTPFGLVVTSTGVSPVSESFCISSTIFVAALWISPRDMDWLSSSSFFPTDLPIPSAMFISLTGSIVDIAANSTKKAKSSVIISAKVPNQPGRPSSTRDIPLLMNFFRSCGVAAIQFNSRLFSILWAE